MSANVGLIAEKFGPDPWRALAARSLVWTQRRSPPGVVAGFDLLSDRLTRR
jgi:hypothetical protein